MLFAAVSCFAWHSGFDFGLLLVLIDCLSIWSNCCVCWLLVVLLLKLLLMVWCLGC